MTKTTARLPFGAKTPSVLLIALLNLTISARAATQGDAGEQICGCSGAQSAAITVIPGVVFSGAVDGAMRAYSGQDGQILWHYDSNRDFTTVNGVAANGGSMIGPGSTVVDGMLYFNVGYGAFGSRAGNVLLAFEAVD